MTVFLRQQAIAYARARHREREAGIEAAEFASLGTAFWRVTVRISARYEPVPFLSRLFGNHVARWMPEEHHEYILPRRLPQ